AFFENGLNTDILHTNIAFPLLNALVREGFQPAQKIFKEEIARRFNEGTFNSRRFLYLQGYLNYLSREEKQILEGYEEFIKKLPEQTFGIREIFMRDRLMNERLANFRRGFERADRTRVFKIVIFGDLGVGKNTLQQRFLPNIILDTRMTIGANFCIKNVSVNKQRFSLRIWNINAEEHFRILSAAFFHGAMGGIFIYDITRQTSLFNLDNWLQTIQVGLRGENRFPIIVVGNKLDLVEHRQVPVETAIKMAKARGMNGYLECSFHTGKNVEKIFKRLVRIILNQQRENT
ncbi:MAG: Rab family GTPase, partial [Promethearchaeota archaeon]